jgi:hypothetical protein
VSGFVNSIAGGGGNLNITTFQNPGYVPGTNGWQITKDGYAEFNNVKVKGTVEAGFFIGYGASGEILIYSGDPAEGGTLLMSVSSAAGADPYGNAYGKGFYLYSATGDGIVAMSFVNQIPVLAMRPLGVTHMVEQPLIYSAAANAGNAGEYQTMIVSSGRSGTGGGNPDAVVELQGASADGSVQAQVFVEFGGNIALTLTQAMLELGVPVTLPNTGAVPATPATGCTLYYSGGSLYALGPSGTPVRLATT